MPDPTIVSFIAELPERGAPWPRREEWLIVFISMFDYLWPEEAAPVRETKEPRAPRTRIPAAPVDDESNGPSNVEPRSLEELAKPLGEWPWALTSRQGGVKWFAVMRALAEGHIEKFETMMSLLSGPNTKSLLHRKYPGVAIAIALDEGANQSHLLVTKGTYDG